MKIKVCGMKIPGNITEVAALPIDYMGFIFYDKSPRNTGPELADWLNAQAELFERIQKVGVFVNTGLDEVLNAVHDYQLDYVQLHGDEDPEYCNLLHTVMSTTSMRQAKLIKAFRVDEDFDFSATAPYEASCDFFVFDTKGETYGGTGHQFSWDVLADYRGHKPFLLSGGIGPDDISSLSHFEHKKWMGVDVNSRFEISPGHKDVSMLKEFIGKLNKI
jgi:phosphoribosylanthranilate isomerase